MDNTTKAFIIADNAKNLGDYITANAVFAYLLAENTQGVKVGYEYLPDWIHEEEKYEGEGIPAGNYSQEDIQNEQYHGLPFIEYKGFSLCIPAPLLSAKAFNDFIKKVGRKKGSAGFQERKDHARETIDAASRKNLLPEQQVSLEYIHKYILDFNVPQGILAYEVEYENPWKSVRVRPSFSLNPIQNKA